MTRQQKIRVLVVDDSPTKRNMLVKLINSHPEMIVIAQAFNGQEGVEKTKSVHPDVVIMDIKMPVMDGLSATKKIMQTNPIPILIVSSTGKTQVMGTLDALAVGAIDFIAVQDNIEKLKDDLYKKIKVASNTKVSRLTEVQKKPHPISSGHLPEGKYRIIVIGVSTGGPTALLDILKNFPSNFPLPIIIVQHMIAGFTEGLAEWLNNLCEITVKEAQDGDALCPGVAMIVPGGSNLIINSRELIELKNISPDAIYQPSIDETMISVAKVFGEKTIAVILTGMGKDGVEGVKEIKKSGGFTIAQDEASSIVWGMPKAAIESGCIDKVVNLQDISSEILKIIQLSERKNNWL